MTIVVAGLVLWIVLVFALLVWEPAMWRAHIAHLVPPMALLAALRPAPWPVLAVVGLVAAPFFVSNNRSILWPDGYTGHEAALVHHLERFPSDAQFISDDPGWVWRSGHRPPGAFADTSYQRIDDGEITEASLAKAAAARRRLRRDLVVADALQTVAAGSATRSRPRATPRSTSVRASRCSSEPAAGSIPLRRPARPGTAPLHLRSAATRFVDAHGRKPAVIRQ